MHASLSDIIADVAANSIEARAKKVVVEVLEENGTIVLRVPKDVKVICEEYDTQVWKSTVEVQSENIDENDATTVYVKGSEIGGCLKVVRA